MTRTSAASGAAVAVACCWAVAPCGAFLGPAGGRQPLLLRPGCGVGQFCPSPHVGDRAAPRGDVSVWLFRDLLNKFKKGGEDGDGDEDTKKSKDVAAAPDVGPEEKEEEEAAPFFAAQYLDSLEPSEKTVGAEAEVTPVESKADEESLATEEQQTFAEPVKEVEVLSPKSQAEKLLAQAARVRLEADKQQVELTLEKIAKLNTQLEVMKKKDTVNAKDQQKLEEELQRLKSQLITDEGGEVKPAAVPVAAKPAPATAGATASSSSTSQSDKADIPSQLRPSLSLEEVEERVRRFEDAPEFLRVLVARTVGFGVDADTPGAVDRLNATDIVRKMHEDEVDYLKVVEGSEFASESERELARENIERAYAISDEGKGGGPKFTDEQIRAKVKELEDIPKFLKNVVADQLNDTEIATMILEEEWKEERNKKKKGGRGIFGLFGDGEDDDEGAIGRDGEITKREKPGTFSRLFSEDAAEGESRAGEGAMDVSLMMETLYPKSTRKEDETPDRKQVDAFLNDVVGTTKAFTPMSDPISVPGGWIIRGKNECKSGAELIDKLDRRIANDARLRDKISFFALKDPFPDTENGSEVDPFNWPQVLFVAGPDVAREPAVVLRTAISSFGIATAWYGSIYPFLANSRLLDRATEQMELADAGMPTDMSWLSEKSIPLFVSFIALQLLHDAAHQVVARSKGFEAGVPTLVPSVMSGITNSITSLKTSPKNKQDLVDFAVAGPLTGMIGSILLLCYGLALTATSDAATVQSFPGLPLAILRSSSLGGGLIDIFLGNGVLNVPASAEGAQALASTLIAMHPFAVAGFFSLVVNALALVPAGRTDGGRISMALFGRSGSQAVTFISLAFLAILGISQSDILLFFFAFITFCQSELEIPMRNEVDDVDVSRAILASFAGFLMLLTLIPMS